MSSKTPPPPPQPALAQQAKDLGYPASVSGLRPNDRSYWIEPGLTWGVNHSLNKDPSRIQGEYVFRMPDNSMAPRFPLGTVVMLWKASNRAGLEIGRPYVYSYADTETGEVLYQAGRLEYIGKYYLGARADNNPSVGLIWPVDRKDGFDMVRVIDAYISYPPEVLDRLPSPY